MRNDRHQLGLRLYDLFMRLLPAAFRHEWGEDLRQTLLARLHDVSRDATSNGHAAFWLHEGGSLLVTTLRAHCQYRAGSITEETMYFDNQDNRPYRVAWACALAVHLLLFVTVFPSSDSQLEAATRDDVVVLTSYEPPPPPELEPETVTVKRVAKRVPIPDMTPDEPEMIMDERIEYVDDLPTEYAGTDYVVGAPLSAPSQVAQMARAGIDVQRPALIRRVQPEYPPLAVRARLECTVMLEARIDHAGNVVDTTVVEGCGLGLDAAAVNAVSQWQYSPTLLRGRPVDVLLTVRVAFRLS